MIFSCFEDGNTSAHIAAKRGSSRVLQELLKFDKNIVTTSRLLFWHFIQVGSPSPFTITIHHHHHHHHHDMQEPYHGLDPTPRCH